MSWNDLEALLYVLVALGGAAGVVAVWGLLPLYRENGRVIELAGHLERRKVEQGAFRLVLRVTGVRRGRPVELRVAGGGWYELRVAAPAVGSLTISPRSIQGWLKSRLSATTRQVSRFELSGDVEAARRVTRSLQGDGAADRLLERCLQLAERHESLELQLGDGWLVVPKLRQFEVAPVLQLMDALVDLAAGLEDLAAFGGRIRQASADGQVCPFCRDTLEGEPARECSACGASHHAACWEENRGCSIFACTQGPAGRPPEREPTPIRP